MKEIEWKRHLYGILFVAACTIQNLIYVAFPPLSKTLSSQKDGIVLTIFEWFGRMMVLFYPIIRGVTLKKKADLKGRDKIMLIIMEICVIACWYYWIAYVLQGRSYAYMFSPVLGVIIPLAALPSIYFICLSVYMESYVMFGASMVFLVAHSIISYNTWLQIVAMWGIS